MIAQLNHQLDIIHDTSPEGMFTLAKQAKDSHGWFKGFPYAHPDPTLPAVIFNDQLDMFKSRDVRWALALLIDIKAVSMASYRGAATISAIGVPPTGAYPETYHKKLEAWLRDFELDTGKQQDQAVRSRCRQGDRRDAAAVDGRSDSHRSRDDRQLRSAAAGGSPTRRPPPNCWRRPATASAATNGTCRTASRSPSTSPWKARRDR